MTQNYDKMVILRIAKYYYLDGLSQQEIADKEKIHRSQISRILKLARELGFVQFRIAAPGSESSEMLADQLRTALDIRNVIVAPELSTQEDPEESFYFFAARYLEECLANSRNIGIGLGKTLYHIGSQLAPGKMKTKPDFFSIVGSSGTDNPYLQASIILENFARPFNGRCHYNNLPICLSRSMMSTLDLNRFSKLREAYRTLDTVVLSLGGALNVDYPYLEEFSLFGKEIDTEEALSRPHGNLLGHVFYDNHEHLILPGDYIITSMELELLEKTPNVICIATVKGRFTP